MISKQLRHVYQCFAIWNHFREFSLRKVEVTTTNDMFVGGWLRREIAIANAFEAGRHTMYMFTYLKWNHAGGGGIVRLCAFWRVPLWLTDTMHVIPLLSEEKLANRPKQSALAHIHTHTHGEKILGILRFKKGNKTKQTKLLGKCSLNRWDNWL